MATSLFPTTGAATQPSAAISFNAGKCAMQSQPNSKFLITPEKRRGQVAFLKGRDGLFKFQWKDRTTGNVDFERIVFPQSSTFKKVKTGREGDRVYLFDLDGQRTFFWLQDKDPAKDDENVKKLNDYLRDPSTIPAAAPAAAAPGAPDNAFLSRLLGIPPPAAAATRPAAASNPAPSATAAPAAPAATLDINSILGQLQFGNINSAPLVPSTPAPAAAPPTSSTPAGALSVEDLQRAMMGYTSGRQAQHPPLQDIVTSEEIVNSGVLDDPAVRSQLVEHLPPGQQSEEFLEENIRSPQFRQAIGSLNDALAENFSGVAANVGIDPAPGHSELVRGDTAGAFLTAVQAAATTPSASTAQPSAGNPNGAPRAEDSKGADGDNGAP